MPETIANHCLLPLVYCRMPVRWGTQQRPNSARLWQYLSYFTGLNQLSRHGWKFNVGVPVALDRDNIHIEIVPLLSYYYPLYSVMFVFHI